MSFVKSFEHIDYLAPNLESIILERKQDAPLFKNNTQYARTYAKYKGETGKKLIGIFIENASFASGPSAKKEGEVGNKTSVPISGNSCPNLANFCEKFVELRKKELDEKSNDEGLISFCNMNKNNEKRKVLVRKVYGDDAGKLAGKPYKDKDGKNDKRVFANINFPQKPEKGKKYIDKSTKILDGRRPMKEDGTSLTKDEMKTYDGEIVFPELLINGKKIDAENCMKVIRSGTIIVQACLSIPDTIKSAQGVSSPLVFNELVIIPSIYENKVTKPKLSGAMLDLVSKVSDEYNSKKNKEEDFESDKEEETEETQDDSADESTKKFTDAMEELTRTDTADTTIEEAEEPEDDEEEEEIPIAPPKVEKVTKKVSPKTTVKKSSPKRVSKKD